MIKTLEAVLLLGLATLNFAQAKAPAEADLKSLQSRRDAAGTRITRLQDLTDVEIVQNAYGYYVDKAQWRSLSELFDENATLEIGGKGIFTGRARVFEYMTVGLGPIGPHDGLLIVDAIQRFQADSLEVYVAQAGKLTDVKQVQDFLAGIPQEDAAEGGDGAGRGRGWSCGGGGGVAWQAVVLGLELRLVGAGDRTGAAGGPGAALWSAQQTQRSRNRGTDA